MPHRFKKAPLRAEEAGRLANACKTPGGRHVVRTFLDTGPRVSERCSLTGENVHWQQRVIRVKGKGGRHGKRSKLRIVPVSQRVRALREPCFALNDKWFIGAKAAQKVLGMTTFRRRPST
jgi:integrase/recombinase XerD